MSIVETKQPESAGWLQRMALGSEFELSMAGFGLMGEPGSIAERLLMDEVRSLPDANIVEMRLMRRFDPLPCGQ